MQKTIHTPKELKKFIEDNGLNWRWGINSDNILDVILFVDNKSVNKWNASLPHSMHVAKPVISYMYGKWNAAFWMNDICEYFGTTLEDVFEETKEKLDLVRGSDLYGA